LIGIGVIAAGFGVVAVTTGGTRDALDSAQAGAAPPPAVSSPPPLSTPRPAAPGPTSTPRTPIAGDQSHARPPAPQISIRVYNNSMIKGLAHHAADQLRQAGYGVTEVGNYPFGIIPTTTVYFQPSVPGQQAQAERIAAAVGAKAEPRFPGIVPATPGLIIIVTDDYHGFPAGK
jgi:hypothetical protein